MVDYNQEYVRMHSKYLEQSNRCIFIQEQHDKLIVHRDCYIAYQLRIQKAQSILQIVSAKLQKNVGERIDALVSLAMSSVFSDPCRFLTKFVKRRNKSECDLLFVKNGIEMSPMSSSGGGEIDIASFALRLVYCIINKTRKVLILDEPFKFLSRDLQAKASEMLQMLSRRLKFQFILVSHIPDIIEQADTIHKLENVDGIVSVQKTR